MFAINNIGQQSKILLSNKELVDTDALFTKDTIDTSCIYCVEKYTDI